VIAHLVTDRRRLSGNPQTAEQCRCLLRQADAAVAAAVDAIQLREPDLDSRDLLAVARELVSIARGSSTRVIVNDRLDVALAAGADGVHLPARGFAPADVRPHVPSGFLIGRSIHDQEDCRQSEGADYLIAGTLFPTPSKAVGHRTLGLSGLQGLVQLATVPVLAIGGVSRESAAAIGGTGAAGIAAIGLFMPSDAGETCRAFDLRPVVDVVRQAFDRGFSRRTD
jgi:thiamine-phosphate pyrophosphorylase